MSIEMTTPFTTTAGTVGAALSAELAALAERVRNGIVEVRDGRGGGAGTIVSPDGLIVTNYHVVPGDRAEVTTTTGGQHAARVVASLPERDLALLRIDVEGLPALALGDSTALRPGELVLAVGHPLGVTGAASLGVFTSIGPIEGRGGRHFQEAILAAIELRPGNSGGPLVNMRGEVVGINAMVLGPHTALAVPSAVVGRLLAAGERRTLGAQIGLVELPPALTNRHGLTRASALLVLGVVEGGAAERAGLLPGDILLRVNGQPLEEPGDLAWALSAGQPSLILSILRGGEPREVAATLDEAREP